jgi:chromosome segregation ATPase
MTHEDYPDTVLDTRVSWKEERRPFYQVIAPETVRNYEESQIRLKNELISVKDKYEGIIQKKNSEIKNLLKNSENLKKQVNELHSQIAILEEKEKKLENFRSLNEVLNRKLSVIEAECEGFRRQLEYARETCETYKNKIDDHERSFRNRTQDVDRDVRSLKDRVEELERLLEREKNRAGEIERRFDKSKERIFALENDLARADERNKRLEKEVLDNKDRIHRESTQQLRETEYLRRKIEDLTQEVIRNPRSSLYEAKQPEFFENAQFSRTFSERPREFREFSDIKDFRESGHREFRNSDLTRRPDAEISQMKEILSPKPSSQENVKSLETKLMHLQIEKKRLEDDLNKIPPLGRKLAQIKRQQEIELELEIITSNIQSVKNRLRHFNIY